MSASIENLNKLAAQHDAVLRFHQEAGERVAEVVARDGRLVGSFYVN